MFDLMSRKLLGERFRSAYTGILIAVVIGAGLSEIGVKIPIAQSVLIFSGIMYSGAIVFNVLASKDNARCLKGLFAMPYIGKRTLLEYAAAVGLYTLFTKTSFLAGLLFAFTDLKAMDILLFMLAFFYALFGGMIAFACLKKRPYISAMILIAAVLLAFLLPKGIIAAVSLGAADVLLVVLLTFIPLENFRVPDSVHIKTHKSGGRPTMLILRYVVRYLFMNKNYIISSLCIIAFSCFFTLSSLKQGVTMACGLGMALISASSPMSMIVSSNRGLKRKLDAMPDKTRSFFLPYGAVVFVYFALCYAIYLTALSLFGGTADIKAFILAPLFAVQCAIFAALAEDRFTITKWNTEQDLWHNPRKYILPVILLFETALMYAGDIIG